MTSHTPTQAERDRDQCIWRRRVAGEDTIDIALTLNMRAGNVAIIVERFKRAYKRQYITTAPPRHPTSSY